MAKSNPALYRTLRTLLQVFGGIFGAQLLMVLTAYQTTHVFDYQTLWYNGAIAGVAGVIAYLMNRGVTEEAEYRGKHLAGDA